MIDIMHGHKLHQSHAYPLGLKFSAASNVMTLSSCRMHHYAERTWENTAIADTSVWTRSCGVHISLYILGPKRARLLNRLQGVQNVHVLTIIYSGTPL